MTCRFVDARLKASTNLEKVKLRLKRKKAFASAGNTQDGKGGLKAAPSDKYCAHFPARSALPRVSMHPPSGKTILGRFTSNRSVLWGKIRGFATDGRIIGKVVAG